jgi:hypothetical protein
MRLLISKNSMIELPYLATVLSSRKEPQVQLNPVLVLCVTVPYFWAGWRAVGRGKGKPSSILAEKGCSNWPCHRGRAHVVPLFCPLRPPLSPLPTPPHQISPPPCLHSPDLASRLHPCYSAPPRAASPPLHVRRRHRHSRSSSPRPSTPSAVFPHWVLRYGVVLIQRFTRLNLNPTLTFTMRAQRTV